MWFAVAGICFGIIGGMGMGGGIILIPILTLFLGVSQHAAQGLNLVAFLPMAVFALITHIRHKRVDIKLALIMCTGGLAGAVIGSLLVNTLDSTLLRKLFGGFLLLLGGVRAFSIIKSYIKKKKVES